MSSGDTFKGDDLLRRKIRKLSIFKFYNENKTIYIVWNNCEEALKYIIDNEIFLKETFKKRKVSINSRLLVSIDDGKNYFYTRKVLKALDGKLKEPYILDNNYMYRK